MRYKYVSKKAKEKQKRRLYNCLRLSIVTGCIYIVALAAGFSLAGRKKPDSQVETIIETIEDDENKIYTKTKAFTAISRWGSYETSELDKIISLSKDDLKYYDGDDLKEFDIKCTPREFAGIIGDSTSNYNSCIDAVYKNKNLDSNTKEILNNAMNTVRNTILSSGVLLAALRHNLANFDIKYVYEPNDSICRFDPYECCLYMNSNVVTDDTYEYALIKGILGYGMTNAYIELDGKKVLCTTAEYCFLNSYDGNDKTKIIKMGKVFEDGLVEGITSVFRQLPIDCNNPIFQHGEDAYILSRVLKIRKIPVSYYINDGYGAVLDEYIDFTPNMRYIIREFDLFGNKFETTLSLYDEYTRYMKNNIDSWYDMQESNTSKEEMLYNTVIGNMECNSSDEFHIIPSSDSKKISPQSLSQFIEPYIKILCKEEDKTK